MISLGTIFRRCYKTTCCLCKYKNTSDMPKVMQKMINKGSTRKKKKWFESSPSQVMGISASPSESKARRAEILSPMLTDHITLIINTGELDPEITLRTVEILKVKVFPDLSVMHVYWKGSGIAEKDDKMQKLLSSNAAKLRGILISYRLLGKMPEIIFKKDISESRYLEMEELLAKVDMGKDEDFEDQQTVPFSDTETDISSKMMKIEQISSKFTRSDSSVTYMGANHYGNDKRNFFDELETIQNAAHVKEDGICFHDNSALGSTNQCRVSFRNDLYGIQHGILMNKIVSARQREVKEPKLDTSSLKNSEFSYSNLSGTKSASQIGKYLRVLEKKKKSERNPIYTVLDYEQDLHDEKSRRTKSINDYESGGDDYFSDDIDINDENTNDYESGGDDYFSDDIDINEENTNDYESGGDDYLSDDIDINDENTNDYESGGDDYFSDDIDINDENTNDYESGGDDYFSDDIDINENIFQDDTDLNNSGDEATCPTDSDSDGIVHKAQSIDYSDSDNDGIVHKAQNIDYVEYSDEEIKSESNHSNNKDKNID